MKKKKVPSIVKMAVTNLVAVPLIGLSAQQVGLLPAGAAKNIAGTTTPIMAAGLAGSNLKYLNL